MATRVMTLYIDSKMLLTQTHFLLRHVIMGWFAALFHFQLFSFPVNPISSAVLVHSYPPTCDSFTVLPLQVATHAINKAGATVWGHESTSNQLFVCSEAEGNHFAYHAAFDLCIGKLLYRFDENRSGEEIAVDPQGSFSYHVYTLLNISLGNTLALFTAGEYGLHLQLYDVGRQDRHHTAATALPLTSQQLYRDASPEVRTVAWSPDGVLLAVGGNDDVAHLYDVRCLERG